MPKNSSVKLKICGMKYPKNITEVASLLPDYMGFIFYNKSARYFDGEIPDIPVSVKKTGVFVNENIDFIRDKIEKYNLRAIQVHGNEDVEYCKVLKENIKPDVEIIKVFSADDNFDFDIIKPYETLCDFYLFDAKGRLPGGNGISFNWNILKKYPSEKHFFLSGGIGVQEMETINEIYHTSLPIYAIDINSKVEIEAGLKNVELCRQVKEMCKEIY